MRLSRLILLISLISCASSKKVEDPSAKKAEIYYNHGTQALMTQEYSKALKNLLQANSLKSNDSRIHNNLGMAYFFKNKLSPAIRHLKLSVSYDPKNTEARLNLATVYMHAKKYNESQMQFDIVLNDLTFEGQFKTYFNLGILSLRMNDQLKAINYFKQSLDESSSYCPANYQLGNIYFKRGQFEKALQNYQAASKGTCYDSPGPHYKQAISYMELKKYDFAQDKLKEILERFSNKGSYQALANKKLKELRKLKSLEARIEDKNIIQDRNILTPDF